MLNFRNKKKQFENTKKLIENTKKIIEERKKIQEELISKHNEELKRLNIYNRLNKHFEIKDKYNSIIPLNLFTCWHTKELPPLMQQNYEKLKADNPEFNHYLYDENDCREFIKNNFDENVLNAYNSLIPCAYKSDLWRYCVLYINGGVYLDIKYKCINGFKFVSLTEKEHFNKDRLDKCIYTALIVTLPKNEILLKCINQIVENVKNKYYGENPLCPSGPGLLGLFFTKDEREKLELYFSSLFLENSVDEYCYIVYQERIILDYYTDYRKEQAQFQKNKHYDTLWREKKIYN